jgi:ribulose-phosphate 3-epimerase
MKIAPSLLSADFSQLKNEVKRIENAGADILHLDVMDGHFVPNLTFGMPIIASIINHSDLPLDVHLMVTNPESYFQELAELNVAYVSFHPETVYHSHRAVNQIKELGMKAGIAINPGISLQTILPLLSEIDYVLIMSVNPGFGGQKFIPSSLEKIQKLDELRQQKKYRFEIEVDGGVNAANAKNLREAGTNILVAGSFIFQADNYQAKIEALRGTLDV